MRSCAAASRTAAPNLGRHPIFSRFNGSPWRFKQQTWAIYRCSYSTTVTFPWSVKFLNAPWESNVAGPRSPMGGYGGYFHSWPLGVRYFTLWLGIFSCTSLVGRGLSSPKTVFLKSVRLQKVEVDRENDHEQKHDKHRDEKEYRSRTPWKIPNFRLVGWPSHPWPESSSMSKPKEATMAKDESSSYGNGWWFKPCHVYQPWLEFFLNLWWFWLNLQMWDVKITWLVPEKSLWKIWVKVSDDEISNWMEE